MQNCQLPDFSSARVLVVGDVMLDRYWNGNTTRISPEAPVPVVHVQETEDRPGGAANVALNIKALGAKVCILGFVGQDAEGDALISRLVEDGIETAIVQLKNIATITKLRIMSTHQQLIRLDFENGFAGLHESAFMEAFERRLDDFDVILFSDYGKGTLDRVSELISRAKLKGKTVLVDPKGTDYSRYQGASLITPNRNEFELAIGPAGTDEEIQHNAKAALKRFDLGSVLLTRGEHGMTLLCQNGQSSHFPTVAKQVYDVTGAGDTVIATLAACLAAGTSMEVATAIANKAAGIVVSKVGTASVSIEELQGAFLQLDHKGGVVTEDEAHALVMNAKAEGQSVVMTNGCFDLLHPGHLSYLQKASALGDRLIIAVNDDASVKRLKKEGRPINCLADRMQMLAQLKSVDWVVPFSEDTPLRLITRLTPNTLVKGGDYQINDIAGADHVLSHGGRVETIQFIKGYSTSSLIKKIKD